MVLHSLPVTVNSAQSSASSQVKTSILQTACLPNLPLFACRTVDLFGLGPSSVDALCIIPGYKR